MKKNSLTLMAVTFISGIVLGVSVLTLFSFTSVRNVPSALAGGSKISLQDAKALTKGFSDKSNGKSAVKGFSISREQLDVLNQLASDSPGLNMFRLYMGYDKEEGSVVLLVGVTDSGQDDASTIYKAAATSTGACPPICDGASTIIGQ